MACTQSLFSGTLHSATFLGERCKSAGKLLNCMLLPLGWFDWWYASSLLYSFTWCPPMQILVVEWQPNLQHAKTHARQNSWTRMISMFWSSEYSIRRKCNIPWRPNWSRATKTQRHSMPNCLQEQNWTLMSTRWRPNFTIVHDPNCPPSTHNGSHPSNPDFNIHQ